MILLHVLTLCSDNVLLIGCNGSLLGFNKEHTWCSRNTYLSLYYHGCPFDMVVLVHVRMVLVTTRGMKIFMSFPNIQSVLQFFFK